ncbi:MAG: Gfo/Idh/MocA family oxidoreductase, partial [Candidatus Hydrogenedentes bacterium]|nr:Gfo/Idh/MocA family oxidoreductase [Candidatus Hydrogenedentota bacterium]
MKNTRGLSRRGFLRMLGAAAAGGAAAASGTRAYARVGANDRVRLAVIGCGGMGGRHVEALATNPQCDLAAVCDVYIPRYRNAAAVVENAAGKRPDGYQDFRRILDRGDIDAILIATPDHWHPLLTILGCQAGKDVYVEKPPCTAIAEGRAMVEAARRYGRVVQVGTQQRSMPLFQEAMALIHAGKLGPITGATAWVGTNGLIAEEHPQPVPDGLDWDLWLGPAPNVPFSPERFGAFRIFDDYARGGELANWGVHLFDIVHWGIGQDRPLSIQALGGTYGAGAGADNYEVIEALLEYPGCTATWEQRHTNTHSGKGYGIRFQGRNGRLTIDRGTFIVDPDSLGIGEVVGEPERSWANPDHHNNFFDSIRTRKRPVADIEQGFRSAAAILLAGIA